MRFFILNIFLLVALKIEACPENLYFDEVCRGDLPYDEVLPKCIERAKKGNPRHMTILANFLSPKDGHGNLEESTNWFLKAIEKDYVPAMYYYATNTMRSYPTGKETAHARLILFKGAQMGDVNSIAQLGYEIGAGNGEFKNDKDIDRSITLLLTASQGRSSRAQRMLISKYKYKKNYVEAYAWNYVVRKGDSGHRSFKRISKKMKTEEIKEATNKGKIYMKKYDSSVCQ